MDTSQDFKSMQEKIQAALVKTTRTSNQIAAEDLSFQRSSNPAVDEELDDTSQRLIALSASLLKSATKGTGHKAPRLEDADDVDAQWTRVVDVIDTLLEKADTCLDEYTGLVKRKAAPVEQSASAPKKPKTWEALDHSMRRANILKPQNAFQLKPDNVSTSPWKPLLAKKPHASLPLENSLGTFNNEENSVQYDYTILLPYVFNHPRLESPVATNQDESQKQMKRKQNRTRNSYKHPYETEILNLQYPQSVYEVAEPIKYQPVETTVATFVDTFEGVLDMLAELKQAKEIAIDTEHHDFRTYSGLLSLMQISTREKDWIVDTLQPWRHKLEVLNEVFADPGIVKVLHGAYMDIIWLQRDCGLYIVGLFDTFHAAESLGYSARSLAYLLKRFVDFDADKKYQLADWRIRPIPDEMFYYARSDTHYLLYVYDMMRNELVQRSNGDKEDENYIEHVMEQSQATSLRRYEKFVYDTEGGQGAYGWFNMLMKQSSGNFSREQFAVFRAVHKWRDDLARREDESPGFIMNNGAVFDIARRLPPDPKALHSLISQASYPAKQSVAELFQVVDKAKADGANGPTLSEFFRVPAQGIGVVAQQVFPELRKGPSETVLETKELVSRSSQLWGQVPISTRWETTSGVNEASRTMQFALPWASFVENASVSEPQGAAKGPLASTLVQQKDQTKEADAYDGEFTLKSGIKRKAPEPESAEDSDEGGVALQSESKTSAIQDEEISVNSTDEEDQAKHEAKAAKKARKKARRERQRHKIAGVRQEPDAPRVATANVEDGDGGEEPFDYSKAKSVLNAQRGDANGAGADGGKGGKGKVFNPYSSLSKEGPKPARRMHGEKPGKSATFKKL
ncbi:exosome complex exonuclease Rrp [Xylariales sp. AK1849]|nr:exosome complex exonuclease Rrp [Xylariales sp. AK1849]